jgi:hypothetical protein
MKKALNKMMKKTTNPKKKNPMLEIIMMGGKMPKKPKK